MEQTAACEGKHDRAALHTGAHVGPHTRASELSPEGTVNHGKPMLGQIYPEGLWSMEKIHTGAGEKCEEKELGERS